MDIHVRNFGFILFFCTLAIGAFAAQTTYTFTGKAWTSNVGIVVTDGKTDGWRSLKDAYAYQKGYDTPQGVTNRGMQVTSKSSGAEAVSVVSFVNVRRLRINYCTNNKAGAGTFVIWIGDNDSVIANINSPSADGNINRDVEICLPVPQTGNVRFKINCTANSLYINSINIKADNAGPSVSGLTRDVFRIVMDTSILKDGDEVMIGVAAPNVNYVMGVFDQTVSRNNIHALQTVYAQDRSHVNEKAGAVYTLGIRYDKETDSRYYTFMDYTGWYLVASGGNPNNGNNNYLTAWDTVSGPDYGLYGGWSIGISERGEAAIKSLGRSRSNLLQFNPNGTTPLFACYQDCSQTAVALYRRETVPDEGEPYIQPAIVNFGTVILENGTLTGSKTIEVNAVNLTEDISVGLKQGKIFSVSAATVDRDGDPLTVSYNVAGVGLYKDTLVLGSGTTIVEIPVVLTVKQYIAIAQACQLEDQTACFLNPVSVTKKYDKYIFVQDATGAMLLFDGANQYGKGLANGDVLTGVTGKYKNYYGNPSLTLTAAFRHETGGRCLPAEQTEALTEADACRYILLNNTSFDEEGRCAVGGKYLGMYNLFGYNPVTVVGIRYDVEAIVYNYNGIVLCPVAVTEVQDTGTETVGVAIGFSLQGRVLCNPDHLLMTIYNSNGTQLLTTDTDIDMQTWQAGVYIALSGSRYRKFILK